MTADLRRHQGAGGQEVRFQKEVPLAPTWASRRLNEKVNRQSEGKGGLTIPNGEEQSRLSEQSHHCPYHPESSGSTPQHCFQRTQPAQSGSHAETQRETQQTPAPM